MSLTYSQNFLLLNTIRSSIYRKHRLNDLASFLWSLLIMLPKKITFVRIKKEVSKEGGTVGTHWNSNDQSMCI